MEKMLNTWIGGKMWRVLKEAIACAQRAMMLDREISNNLDF